MGGEPDATRSGRARPGDPRMAQLDDPRRLETLLEAMAPQLQAMGHTIDYRPPTTFKGNAIEWVNGHWAGAADPRSEGAAVSE